MAWCKRQRVGYIFGLAGNKVLLRQVSPLAEDAAFGRLDGEGEKVRRWGDFRYAAKSWTVERRVIARLDEDGTRTDRRDHRNPPCGCRSEQFGSFIERRDQIALSKDEEIAPVDNLSQMHADEPAASRRIRFV